MVNTFGPLSAIINTDLKGELLSYQEVLTAVKDACRLLGDGSSRLSQLCREKLILDMNKSLLPLVKEEDLKDSAFNLGSTFAKKSKEYVEQVKAIWSTLSTSKDRPKQSLFSRCPPRKQGGGFHTGHQAKSSWMGGRSFNLKTRRDTHYPQPRPKGSNYSHVCRWCFKSSYKLYLGDRIARTVKTAFPFLWSNTT